MISVILTVEPHDSKPLARTLENLVSYAVEGFVQEVVVMHSALDETTRYLAEEAGCNLVENEQGLPSICADARGDWLLFMEPGATLAAGWAEIVDAHARADGSAAIFRISVTEARPFWRRILQPRISKSPLARGLLISKRQARANLKNQETPVELMRGIATKRLHVGIFPA